MYTYWTGPTPTTSGSVPGGSYTSYHSQIETFDGYDGRMRPCHHVRSRASANKVSENGLAPPYEDRFRFMAPNGTVTFLGHEELGDYYVNEAYSLLPDQSILSDSQWESYDQLALQNMLPSASNGVSLLNFLFELKDFRRLADAFWKRKGRMATAIFGSNTRYSIGQRLKKKTLKSLSEAYLSYSFAWAPFVSDILKLVETLSSVDERLKTLWERQNQPQTRHFSTPLEGYDTEWVWSSENNASPSASRYGVFNAVFHQTKWRYTIAPVYRATARFTYACPGVLDTRKRLAGYLDAFGVKLDPSIIWNAIPFSFLVDYVRDVGGFLRRFSIDNLGLQITLEDFCSSLKYDRVSHVVLRAGRMTAPSTRGPDVHMANAYKGYYERRTGIPNLYAAATASGIDAREASLAAALLLANSR